ncbi:hypothetical protein CDAR_14941 [Caerostris darwini]|uniref:Uncharacterized protein n=1 Tax=Caerostris darwini TaxID=1538125 RepID=A0AAV4WBA2_9ARAC|nr:hypothetical protein CDAR_14941 [Caerostris darwini]
MKVRTKRVIRFTSSARILDRGRCNISLTSCYKKVKVSVAEVQCANRFLMDYDSSPVIYYPGHNRLVNKCVIIGSVQIIQWYEDFNEVSKWCRFHYII